MTEIERSIDRSIMNSACSSYDGNRSTVKRLFSSVFSMVILCLCRSMEIKKSVISKKRTRSVKLKISIRINNSWCYSRIKLGMKDSMRGIICPFLKYRYNLCKIMSILHILKPTLSYSIRILSLLFASLDKSIELSLHPTKNRDISSSILSSMPTLHWKSARIWTYEAVV